MEYLELLRSTDPFKARNSNSRSQIEKIRSNFKKTISTTRYGQLSVFVGGSLGRGDVGNNSDLDLFILSQKKGRDIPRIDTLELLAMIIYINKELGYPEFSNDGQYLRVYSFPDMLDALGSPADDVQNLFTVRMLLLLESRWIFNKDVYELQIENTIEHYFRDSRGKQSYRPLFLVNDILRYWRTVCLNYELIRNDKNRLWRKKNINLKFSRMLTVFGSVLPLIAEPASTKDCVKGLIRLTPLERLAYGIDLLSDKSLETDYVEFLDVYENFLAIKEKMTTQTSVDDASVDRQTKEWADVFSWFLHRCLTHENINEEYRKYLVL